MRKKIGPRAIGLPAIALLVFCWSGGPALDAQAYQIDKAQHLITISPVGDYTADAQKALDFLVKRPDKNEKWSLQFQPGLYYMRSTLYAVGLENVDILSNPKTSAKLIKGDSFNAHQEHLFYIRMSHDIRLYGFEFYGKTSFKDNSDPVWTDQGVYFGSSHKITVDSNKFYNFGNAALRVTTNEEDPVKGVNSSNTTVTNNYFNNFYQVSTTSNDKLHGATRDYRMEKNTFVNVKGAIKFASRTAGAKGLHLLNNTINGSEHFGFEINNYDDVEIRDNSFQNIKSVAINIYTAGDSGRMDHGFPWGNNFTIANNSLKTVGTGIRYCHEPFFDGAQNIPNQVAITNSTLSNVTETVNYIPAIVVSRGKVNKLNISSNKFYSVANKNYIGIVEGCTDVVTEGNLADGEPISPKITPAPKTSAKK